MTIVLPLILALAFQSTPLPRSEGRPPPVGDEAQVLGTVTRLLDGLTTRDVAAMRRLVRADGFATAVIEGDGAATVRRMPLGQFVGVAQGRERLVERLEGPAVEVDGDIAMVWSPYTFLIDGKVSHCGTNHFSLLREGGAWRIEAIAWTQRKTGCRPA